VALERQLTQMAPCVAVVADPVVPLVVDELAGGVARRRRLATPAADVAQGPLQLRHALAWQLAGEIVDVEPERVELVCVALPDRKVAAFLQEIEERRGVERDRKSVV